MKLFHHIICFIVLFALSPCKEVMWLLDSDLIAKTYLSISTQQNQNGTEEKLEKEKEDQYISKNLFLIPASSDNAAILVDDHTLPFENHSNTETPPPNH